MTLLDVVLAGIPVGESTDPRPCIVIGAGPGYVELLPCSSQFDAYRPARDFLIPADAPEFDATGLSRRSYVIGGRVFRLERRLVRKSFGALTGSLAEEFRRWLGSTSTG